jgi:hypothetical protein
MELSCALSDLPEPFSGNFTVWPGSHHYIEKFFDHDGSALQGTPQADLPNDPLQITGKAGDAVLVLALPPRLDSPQTLY